VNTRLLRGFGAAAVAIAAVPGVWFLATTSGNRSAASQPVPAPARYVGQRTCATCHQQEAEKWIDSDHAHSMQPVTAQSVLGDFNDRQFTYAGVTSMFYKRGDTFFVRTDGPDGKLHDYEIAYTFGVRPLQQYLIAFPDGRLQPLGIAWDSRPKTEGGQRWFHLYPDQHVTHTDPLHWTSANQNWNFMCAGCHSTNLQRNYDLEKNRYATTWSDINVSCESCHGPGSSHVAWADARKRGDASADDRTKGLIRLLDGSAGNWQVADVGQPTARWTGPPRPKTEVEMCAPCHARSRPIASTTEGGHSLLDSHMPALLENGLYFPDGQVLDEVFEYGSFTQSKMHRAGVRCSDCHDPHSMKLRAEGNATCTSCHRASTFDSAEHHRHRQGSDAALCVSCHMPRKNYMVIDERRDHSFRVPRPDVSAETGSPNACTQCHTTKSAQWAADAVAHWYGPNRHQEPHYASAIAAGRHGLAHAETSLAATAANQALAPIVRATALSLLADYVSPVSLPAIQAVLDDRDPIVRAAAVRTLDALPWPDRLRLGAPALTDEVRAVRIEGARVLAGAPPAVLSADQRGHLDKAVTELVAAEMAAAERPDSHVNLGTLYARMGRVRDAEASLRTALRLDPRFVPALINLADLHRGEGRDDQGETLLRQAIAIAPDSAEARHSLGLLLVRQQRSEEALTFLRQAVSLQPGIGRYTYAYALALHARGDIATAVAALEQVLERSPGDQQNRALLEQLRRAGGASP
jgi:tetratricopeptide (TPR) repeat protein